MTQSSIAIQEEYPHGHPFWIWQPTKDELLSDPYLTLMDLFQEGHAFVHGPSGRSAHSDSYMTVLDYGNSRKVFDIIQAEYQLDRSVWEDFADNYLIGHTNPQPIPTLLGHLIKSLIKSPNPKPNTNQ
jgi:hypothetical protein